MPHSAQESAEQFKALYAEQAWPPQERDNILLNFTNIFHDEEWYHCKTMEMPEVGSYNPKKISSFSVMRPTEAQLAVRKCQELAEQWWESILQQSTSAEEFYIKLSGSIHTHMEPKSFDEEY